MSATQNTNSKQASRAMVVVRGAHGGNIDFRPVRIYLINCPCNEAGKAIIPARATTLKEWARVEENEKATRRVRCLVEKANGLANQVNTGLISFEAAVDQFAPAAR